MLVRFELGNLRNLTKHQYKRLVNNNILEQNRQDLLYQMNGYKKINAKQFSDEEFGIKEYFIKMKHEAPRR